MNRLDVKKFFKNYGYWVGLIVSLIVLAVMIALVATRNTDPTTSTIKIDEPVSSTEVVFGNPLSEVSLTKDFSSTKLQFSKTYGWWQSHKAMDFEAKAGSEVYAVMDGTIKEVTYNYLMGNIVKLDVGGGIVVVYASLESDIPVKAGDKVTKGSVIGKVGTTAKSESVEGAHLHLEVFLNDEAVDPNLYLDVGNK